MTEILNIQGLSAGYGPLRVIHDLDLVINAGERVGLVGLNGQFRERMLSGPGARLFFSPFGPRTRILCSGGTNACELVPNP